MSLYEEFKRQVFGTKKGEKRQSYAEREQEKTRKETSKAWGQLGRDIWYSDNNTGRH